MVKEEKKTAVNVLKVIIVGLLGFAGMLLVFSFGVWVGQERADFSFRWAENYHRNFGGPQKGFFGNFPAQDFTNGHGIFGQIIKIDGNNLIVKGQDNMEKTVIVPDKATIVNNISVIKLSDIKVNDNVVIIGSPDSQSQVTAKFIRIFPSLIPVSIYINNFYLEQKVISPSV